MPTLEERVTLLESLIGGVDETAQPNYITVDPITGQVGATFTGIVHALGLILPAGVSGTPAAANEITWQRTTDGAQIANISGVMPAGYAGNQSRLILQSNNPATPGVTQTDVELDAFTPGTQWSSLVANANSAGADSSTGVFATAVGASGTLNQATIIDGSGNSSFAWKAGTWISTGVGSVQYQRENNGFYNVRGGVSILGSPGALVTVPMPPPVTGFRALVYASDTAAQAVYTIAFASASGGTATTISQSAKLLPNTTPGTGTIFLDGIRWSNP